MHFSQAAYQLHIKAGLETKAPLPFLMEVCLLAQKGKKGLGKKLPSRLLQRPFELPDTISCQLSFIRFEAPLFIVSLLVCEVTDQEEGEKKRSMV